MGMGMVKRERESENKGFFLSLKTIVGLTGNRRVPVTRQGFKLRYQLLIRTACCP